MFAVTLDNTHQDHHSQWLLVLSRHFLRLYLIHNTFQDTYIYICVFVLDTFWLTSHGHHFFLLGIFIDVSFDTTLLCSASKSPLVPSPAL